VKNRLGRCIPTELVDLRSGLDHRLSGARRGIRYSFCNRAIRFVHTGVLADVPAARKVGYKESGLQVAHDVHAKWATRKVGYK
jgi:hypothetical protein